MKIEKITPYMRKTNASYLTGVLLGINAIPDATIIIDGPDCSFFKSDIIYRNHDLFSQLKSPTQSPQVRYTGLTVKNIIKGHEDKITREIQATIHDERTQFLFVSSFPMAQVLGIQYEMLLNETAKQKCYAEIRGSIKKDWLDGYEEIFYEMRDFG